MLGDFLWVSKSTFRTAIVLTNRLPKATYLSTSPGFSSLHPYLGLCVSNRASNIIIGFKLVPLVKMPDQTDDEQHKDGFKIPQRQQLQEEKLCSRCLAIDLDAIFSQSLRKSKYRQVMGLDHI
jgi:hypothetical protein